MAVADVSANAEAALGIFAKEPFRYALRPVVKRVLETISSSKTSNQVSSIYFPQSRIYLAAQCDVTLGSIPMLL